MFAFKDQSLYLPYKCILTERWIYIDYYAVVIMNTTSFMPFENIHLLSYFLIWITKMYTS